MAIACFAAAFSGSASTARAQEVEIEVRNTATSADDYLTWAPVGSRIRLRPGQPGAADRVVVLTNDPQQPIPPGRTTPLDGDVVFSATNSGSQQAQDWLELVLPGSGDWVSFAIAGKYPRASSRGKDAIVEVHDGSAAGPNLLAHPVMVRIRRDARQLTDFERNEFLAALNDLHRVQAKYEPFVAMHDLAAKGKMALLWPDQAHGAAAFLAWHRAFLLQFERALQERYPHVTLPYWRQDQPSPIFSPQFMGTNVVNGATQDYTAFDPGNPLFGWSIAYEDLGALVRAPIDHSSSPVGPDGSPLRDEGTLMSVQSYGEFRSKLETNPHNYGHVWTGGGFGWMTNCRISPSDPVFWLFHTEHDRLWAKWQWTQNRFRTDGVDLAHYAPAQPYTTGSNAPLGHHLPDTMWPWDGTSGPQIAGDARANRPDNNPFGMFIAASWPQVWPTRQSKPTPADVIDYLGLDPHRLGHGVAYDDVPYGAKTGASPMQATAATAGETAMASGPAIGEQSADTAMMQLAESRAIFLNAAAADDARLAALSVLLQEGYPNTFADVLTVWNEQVGQSERMDRACVETLHFLMHFSVLTHEQHDLHRTILRNALNHTSKDVRDAALARLASVNDSQAVGILAENLQSQDPEVVKKAITLLRAAGVREHGHLIRPFLSSSNPEVGAIASLSLTGDEASLAKRLEILRDPEQPRSLRLAALNSAAQESDELPFIAITIARNPDEDVALRRELGAVLGASIAARSAKLSEPDLARLVQELQTFRSQQATDIVPNQALDEMIRATEKAMQEK